MNHMHNIKHLPFCDSTFTFSSAIFENDFGRFYKKYFKRITTQDAALFHDREMLRDVNEGRDI